MAASKKSDKKKENSAPDKQSEEHSSDSGQFTTTAEPVVVGMGASAGGLESLMAFFDHTPSSTGAGYVVITHLDPHHNSMMPELLQKHTLMKVEQVSSGMIVQPDTVYVIPPNTLMGIFGRRLQLLERDDDRASLKPVDYFLRSLAQDQGERAICIIFSGMDNDGTQGLLSIKSELGLAIAQDPNTARFASMPQSAIDTGQVDFVLPPEEMSREIVEFIRHFSSRKAVKLSEKEQIPEALRQIFMLLRSATGHDFSVYKRSTVLRRIERRLSALHIDTIQQYATYLSHNRQESELLLNELLIGVTGFFRDPEAFNALETIVIRRLLDGKPDGAAIRIWIVGCSTGEEAYSIAMLLKEYMINNKKEFAVQIFATDIDERALLSARSGTYPATSVGPIGERRLSHFFAKENTSYRIKREIREMLIFASHNALKDPPFTRLDLISCRNLLIYLSVEAQNSLLPLLHFSLRPDGMLFLGNSETVGQHATLFSPLDKKWKLYSKINVPTPGRPVFEFPSGRQNAHFEEKVIRKDSAADMERNIEKLLLKHYHPDSVIINEKGSISYVYGHTGKYLEAPHGTPRSNLFEMARDGLRIPLIAAVRRAVQEETTITVEGRVHDEVDFNASATVIPVKEPANLRGLLLVLFQSLPNQPVLLNDTTGQEKQDEYVQQLEKELQAARENLQ